MPAEAQNALLILFHPPNQAWTLNFPAIRMPATLATQNPSESVSAFLSPPARLMTLLRESMRNLGRWAIGGGHHVGYRFR